MLNVTDSITFVTGFQGHGKTLFALAELARCEREEGATIYQINVNNPDESRFPTLPVPLSEWMSLPANTVVLVDEAHKDNAIPQRIKDTPPPWLKEMAEARKRGIRFIFCTQAGEDVDVFIRRRCARHIHVERKGGMDGAMLYDNAGFFDVRNPAARADTQKRPVKYPKEIFGTYDSAQEHFIKRKIPLKVWAGIALLAIALPGALIFAVYQGTSLGDEPEPVPVVKGETQRVSHPSATMAGLGGRAPSWRTAEEFIAAHTPLVAGIPWSAPIYAEMQPTAQPDILCVISQQEDGSNRCRCYTEQVTRLDVPRPVCIAYAEGGVYNPYRPRLADGRGEGGAGANEVAPPPAPEPVPVAGVRTDPAAVGSPRGGEVWGKHPETLRTANVGD